MKTYKRIGRPASMLGAVLLSSSLASGQATPQPTPGAAEPAEDTIVLSPFEVTTSGTLGYQETETLAGTRIRTSLKDVGSAISIYNAQFLQDIAATDNQSLLQYAVSTEVGGGYGNFGGLGDGAVPNDNGARLRPNSNTRVRGLDTADNTRDFFATDIPWDSYNTSRIDIQRGANSVLFGQGSGAGIINGAIDAAIFSNTGQVEFRTDENASFRGSLNVNRVLVEDELAVRLAYLYDNRKYQAKPAYNLDRRVYGAIRYEPAALKRGNARTTIRANVETGRARGNRPNTTPPIDAISPWFRTTAQEMHAAAPYNANGDTLLGTFLPFRTTAGYDPFVTGIANGAAADALRAANPNRLDIGSRVAGNPNTEPMLTPGAGPGVSGDWYGGLGVIYPDPNSASASFLQANGTGGFMVGGRNAAGAIDGNISGLRGPNIATPPRLETLTSVIASGFNFSSSGLYRSVSLTDPEVFNFHKNLLAGHNKYEINEFDAFNITIDQTFWNDMAGISLTYDDQYYYEKRSDLIGSSANITIDVLSHLPIADLDPSTGNLIPRVNPNFGRPFIASNGDGGRTWIDRETIRLTPFVDLDLRDRDNFFASKIFGRMLFTGLLESTNVERRGMNFIRNTLSDADADRYLVAGSRGLNGVDRKVVTVNYLGPRLTSLNNANLSRLREIVNPVAGTAFFFDSTWVATGVNPADPWTAGGTTGLLPNQNGVAAANQVQAENPANYAGWAGRNVRILNSEAGDLGALYTGGNIREDETKSWALIDQWTLLDGHLVGMVGIRKDEIKAKAPAWNQIPNSANTSNNGRLDVAGMPDLSAIPWNQALNFKSDLLKTYSVVAHMPESWSRRIGGIGISAIYSKSENFRPAARVDIFGDPISPPTGETTEYGVVLTGFEGKVSLKINRFETDISNATLPNELAWRSADAFRQSLVFAHRAEQTLLGTPIAGGGFEFRNTADATDQTIYAYEPQAGTVDTWTTQDWQNAQTYAQSVVTAWNAHRDSPMGQRFLQAWQVTTNGTDNGGPPGFAYTGDTSSEGYEFEIFAQPTPNWNIAVNASKVSAHRVNQAGEIADWLDAQAEAFQGLAGDMRWWGGGQGNFQEARARFSRNAYRTYNLSRALEGTNVPELRPWRFNLVSNYAFQEGRLKGFNVGGAFRWEDKDIIGFGITERFPAAGAASPAIGFLDVSKPFYGPSESHVDLWVGYNRRIRDGLDWNVQLNLVNVGESDGITPINTNPDGSGASYRITNGMGWRLTTRFKF